MTDAITAAKACAAGAGYGFADPLRLDNPTYLVAPGPNGAEFARQLDRRESVIALNKACELKAWRYWLCIDANAYRCAWYHKVAASSTAIMGQYITDPRAKYIMRTEDCPGDTGVCGAALMLCQAAGLRCVVLVGVDMQGGYYDGTPSSYSGEWAHLPHLQAQIEQHRRSDMLVYSASPTRLDVPAWEK